MTLAVPPVWRPATARSVALDAPWPLPRGVLPSDVPPPVWPAKDPGDVLDYEVDIAAMLAGDPADQVATVAVTIVPSASPGDLTLGRVVASHDRAVLWLSAGQAGTNYSVQVTIGTLNGRVISRAVLLPVLALGAVLPPTATLTADNGTIITDQNGNPILVGG